MSALLLFSAMWLERPVASLSVLAPLLLLFAAEAGIPILIPGDAVLLYVGSRVSRSHTSISIWVALGAALALIIIGSSILYFAAGKWGEPLIEKVGRFIFVKEKHIKKAEKLFARYGVWAIIVGRHLPGMRIPITVFSAASEVTYLTFILSTVASTALWALFYLSVGFHYSGNIHSVIDRSVGVSAGVLAGLAVIIISLRLIGAHRARARRHDA